MKKETKPIRNLTQSYIVRQFFNGLFVALPILIILAVIHFLFRLILNYISPIADLMSMKSDSTHWAITLLAAFILFACFVAFGAFLNTQLGRKLFGFIEKKVLMPIPFYSTVSNIVEQFRGQGERPFKDVVLVDPYNSGAKMVGFVVEHMDPDEVVVYVPTAPNPTNGFVFYMKEKDLNYTGLKTEDAMATVIGMGAGSKKVLKNHFEKNHQ